MINWVSVFGLIAYRYKLRNIEETEAAKKLLQEKRLMGRTKSEFTIPSSYSADYFQRGRDYAEKLRRGWLSFFLLLLSLFFFLVSTLAFIEFLKNWGNERSGLFCFIMSTLHSTFIWHIF